jgi:beta-lactamase regulating signal transducer with metallopeptidase domain
VIVEAGLTAKTVLATLGMMAVQGTLLALIAVAIVRAGRLRPAWQAAVWLVVLAKFALPWGPAMPWSLADLLAIVRGGETGGAAIAVAGPAPAQDAAPALLPAVGWLALAAMWFAGSLSVLVRARRVHRSTLCHARAAFAAPAEARALLATLAARVGVRAPRLVVGRSACGPHVVGAVRPVIVIPPALLGDPALLRAALLHELAHVRRRDAFGRAIQLLARSLFWFLPVVRLASRALEHSREAACDAWALEAGDVSRPAYARLLVRMAQLRTPALALAQHNTLDARVAAVLGPPARARLGWVHRFALLAWVAVSLGGARTAAARGERNVCVYTPELAGNLLAAHPEADLNGDGVLSREEACDYQAELRRRVSDGAPVSPLDDTTSELLDGPLCCNCDPGEGISTSAGASCQSEGAN